MYAAESEEGNR